MIVNKSYWVINITNMNVSLSDLNLTIPASRKMNLLDKKHFNYTLEQLELSSKSGSLFKKRDKIKLSELTPIPFIEQKITMSNQTRIVPKRSFIKTEEKVYEELSNLDSDQKFADEFSDLK